MERNSVPHEKNMNEKAEGEKGIRRFEKVSVFELVDFEHLDSEEQTAVNAALEIQKRSEDLKWRVGAAAVGQDGTTVAVHNDGPQGHAEQRALSALYAALTGKKELKMIALAGAEPGDPVMRRDIPYGETVEFEGVDWMKPCAKCLEYIHDRTANVPDVKILSVAITGQVMRTSLRSLLPSPHTSIQVPLDHVHTPSVGKHTREE